MLSIGELMSQTTQNMTDNNIDENGDVILDNFLPLRENEEIIDNMIYCTICKEPKIYVGIDWRGVKIARRCVCTTCSREREKREKEAEEQRKKLLKIEQLKKRSLIDERYQDKHFSDLDLSNNSFKNAYNRCAKYCEMASIVKENAYGIYLYGDSGTGKTLLTSCMANALIEKEYTVLFTNFFEISRAIRNTYNNNILETDDSIINSIADVDFLFIDDLGTESLAKNSGDNFMQDKIYEIIDKRYRKEKPTIFSSNYLIKELAEKRNFMDKTVDRINEMSSLVLEIEGSSYRIKKVKEQEIPF